MSQQHLHEQFVQNLRILTEEEGLGVLRIVRNHAIPYTENSSGVRWLMADVPEQVFKELRAFVEYCLSTRAQLQDRDTQLARMQVAVDHTVQAPTPAPTTMITGPDTRELDREWYASSLLPAEEEEK